MMDDCLFCRIARGELPTTLVYEDDRVIAFDDINPQAPVHTLIIPRTHYVNLNDDIPAEDLAACSEPASTSRGSRASARAAIASSSTMATTRTRR